MATRKISSGSYEVSTLEGRYLVESIGSGHWIVFALDRNGRKRLPKISRHDTKRDAVESLVGR